ncbi:replicative DNA helicase [bacterium]|nr:replicative DNA helicase [bacterium]
MDAFAARQLPHNEHAEASLLGCLMQNGERFALLDEVILTSDEFYSKKHQLIFSAIVEIAVEGKDTIDIVTVHDFLVSTGDASKIGDWSYLSELVDSAPVVDNEQVVAYSRMVKNSALHRLFIEKCEIAASKARKDQRQFDDLLDVMTTDLIDLANSSSRSDVQDLRGLVVDVVQDMSEKIKSGHKSLLGLPSGYPTIDKVASGFKPGDMIVIAARPGVGKTSLAMNMTSRVANKGHSVLFFTLEMPADQVTKRILSAETGVDMLKILNADLTMDELASMMNQISVTGELPIYIDDSSHLTVASLRSKAKSLRATLQKTDQTLDLIVIDYIGLMQGPAHLMSEKKNAQVEEISRGLKLFAKDMKIPIIILSQLNRQVESRKEKVPQLSDLRDSGAIEQDADLVCIINRATDGSSESAKAELHILKNRHGPTGVVQLHFNASTTVFTEIDYQHES